MSKCSFTKSCPSLCNSTDYSPPGCPVHGISHRKILEWLLFPPPGDLSIPGIEPTSLALAGRFFTTWGTWERPLTSIFAYMCVRVCVKQVQLAHCYVYFHGQRSPVGYSQWGCKELDTTERLTHTCVSQYKGCLNALYTLLSQTSHPPWTPRAEAQGPSNNDVRAATAVSVSPVRRAPRALWKAPCAPEGTLGDSGRWGWTAYDQGDLPPVQWTPGSEHSLSDPQSYRFRPVWAAIRSSPSVSPVRGCMGSRHAGVKPCRAPPWVWGLSKFLRGPSSSGKSFPTAPSGTGDRCPLLPQIMSARPQAVRNRAIFYIKNNVLCIPTWKYSQSKKTTSQS